MAIVVDMEANDDAQTMSCIAITLVDAQFLTRIPHPPSLQAVLLRDDITTVLQRLAQSNDTYGLLFNNNDIIEFEVEPLVSEHNSPLISSDDDDDDEAGNFIPPEGAS